MEKDYIKLLKEEQKRFKSLLEYSHYKPSIMQEDDGEEPIDMGFENDMQEPDFEESVSDEVEIDITDLVKSQEEVKEKTQEISTKYDSLLDEFNKLEKRLANMDNITAKIDSLKTELEKRVPTQVEKLNMSAKYAYPFDTSVKDYWINKEQEGKYIYGDEPIEKEEEYVITVGDIKNYSSSGDIKNSF
jgi:predicted nuclease with TOPRIM domain